MTAGADSAAETGRATRIVAAGIIALTFAFVPGMANPFMVGKEALVALLTSFTLLIVAAERGAFWHAWPAWWFAMPAVAAVTAMIAAVANDVDLLASNGVVRILVYAALMLALRFGCDDAAAARRLAAVVAVAAAVEATIVIAQVVFGHLVLDTTGLPSDKWKAFGTLGNPNWTGGYLAVALPLALWRAVESGGRAWWFMSVSIAVGLGATLSRGAWIAAVASTAVLALALDARRRAPAVLVSLTALAVGVIIAWSSYGTRGALDDVGRTGSIGGRLRMWQVSATMIGDRPVLGWGPGRFAAVYPGYQRALFARSDAGAVTDLTDHPHSEYFYLAVELGAVGIVVALTGVFFLWRTGSRHGWRRPLVPWVAGLTAVAVHAVFDVPLHLPVNAALSCLLLAGFVATAIDNTPGRRGLSGPRRVMLAIVGALVLAQAVRVIVVDGALRESRRAMSTGEIDAAARAAQEGLWLEPSNGELLTTLARAQAQGGEEAAALASARQAAELLPSPTLSYLIADLEEKRGAPDRAADELRRLSETLPGLLLPHIRLAEIHVRGGEMESAKNELRRGLAKPSKFSNRRQDRMRELAATRLHELESVDVRQ